MQQQQCLFDRTAGRRGTIRAFVPLSRVVCVCVRVTTTSPVCWYLAGRRWLPWLRVSKMSVIFGSEGFEGGSVVRMARGKFCFRLPFCRQEAVRARQKAVTASLNSRDLIYRLGPAPKSGTRPI